MIHRKGGRSLAAGAYAHQLLGAIFCALLVTLLTVPVRGQAVNNPVQDTAAIVPLPATPAPVPAKDWTLPRRPDGQPDVEGLGGIWGAANVSSHEPLERPGMKRAAPGQAPTPQPSRIADPANGRVPYQPWAAERRKQQAYNRDHPTKPEHIDTQTWCLYAPPRMAYGSERYRLIQPPGYVVFVWDRDHEYRIIPISPEKYADPGPKLRTWMGLPHGHWEGNTLVVENAHHRGILLTSLGDFVTADTKYTERYQFVNDKTVNYEVRIEDPKVFTQPWTLRSLHQRRNDEEFWEEACREGMTAVEFQIFDQFKK